jgi:recombination protein RecR
MDSMHELAALFQKFPGIGPRQAQRFVQYLLRSSPSLRRELVEAITELGSSVKQCPECKRFFEGRAAACERCNDSRDGSLLMVIASDQDADAVERAGVYKGMYFVLGGTVHLGLEKQPHLREADLAALMRRRPHITEVILAFPANPEGDTTAHRIKDLLAPFACTITMLGRGLSTGSELEYADGDTIKHALARRENV